MYIYKKEDFRKVISRYYQVVLQHHLLNQMHQLQQPLLRLVVEQQLIEHNMLDNTKQLHQEVHFVVENQVVELLIELEVVVPFDPTKTNMFFKKKKKEKFIVTICAVFNHCDHC
jgi:hypothetical protein